MKKFQATQLLPGEFYPIFKTNNMNFLEHLLETSGGRNTYQLIYELSFTLLSKLDKDITRKLQINIPHKHRSKNP